MKKLLISFLCFFLISFSSFAQWTPLSVGSTQDLYGIEYNSSSLIFIAGTDGLIKSVDGGATWTTLPLLDVGGSPILSSIIYDVHFFDAFTGVATGLMATGNSEVILRTTNGGVNWSTVSLYNSGVWPRNQNDIYFPSSTIGYSVGTNGRILKSINAGATWSLSASGTTQSLYSVSFTSTSTGFAVGNNIILKTINSGASWTQISFPGVSFKSVYFPTTTTGYAVADNSKIYKTTNSGVSWSLVPVYGTYSFTDVFFTAQDTGYVTSGNVVLKTNNGGALWEEQIVSSATIHNGIAFLNSSDGILVGKNGNAYKTSNSGGIYGPIASFSTSTSTFCKDSIFSFINNGPVGYTYQWFLNGTLFSSAYNPSYSFSNANQTDTISLVAFNGLLYDTAYQYPYVQPALNFTINTVVVNDSICPSTSASIQVTSSVVGVAYKLRNGTTQIGATQNGTGGTLSFSTGSVASTTAFNILGTKTNACGTFQQVKYDTVYVIPNNNLLAVSATATIICKNSSTNVTVGSSAIGTMYQLKVGGTAIGTPIIGNGSTISLPSGNLMSTTTFSIQATSPLGCVSLLTNTITITVEVPQAYFTVGSYNVGVGELVECFNTSVNPGGTYGWNFGVGATTPSSALMVPIPFSYSSLGNKTIRLIAISPNGCADTAQINVNVINYDTTGSCYISQMNCISSTAVLLHSAAADASGNWYCFGDYASAVSQQLNLFSPIIADTIKLPPGGDENVFISKYNKFGVVQWAINSSGAGKEYSKAISVDGQGNVFVLGYTQYGPAEFNSTDGSTVLTAPVDRIFLCKYDKNGVLKMVKNFSRWYYDNVSYSITTDSTGNIYFSTERNFYKLDSNGNTIWSKTIDYYANATVDPNGDSYIVSENGLVLQKFNPMGVLQWQTPFVAVAPPESYPKVWSKIIKKDEVGNIYVFGIFQLNFIFNGDTLYNANPIGGPVQHDIFIAKFSPTGSPLAILQGESSFNGYISGAGIKNGLGYLLGTNDSGLGDTLSFGNLPTINTSNSSLFLLQFDTLLRPRHLIELIDQLAINNDNYTDGLTIDANENIIITSTYRSDFTLAQIPVLQIGCCSNGSFTAKLDTSCIFINNVNVWPGDANNDSVANNFDLLPIGLYYSQTGSPRSTISNIWQAYPSAEWGATQSNGSDINHADCNGDGVINSNDTLAVNLNFASIHAFSPLPSDEARLLLPPMYFSTSSTTYLPGDWINVDVMLGTSVTPVSNLYGIAFNINYDASSVEAGTESLTYPASWLATPGTDGIKLSKIISASNTAYGAETRINQMSADGYGKIATFRFQAKSTITTMTQMNFSFSAYSANDSVGTNLFFSTIVDSINIVPLATALNDKDNINDIGVYPNPYSGSTNIYYSLVRNSDVVIEVYNTIGQRIETIVDENQSAGEHKYSFSAKQKGYEAGIYFVKFTIDGKTTMRKIVEVK